jgi:predicted lipoprotein with Yx(FWY)xxD motif
MTRTLSTFTLLAIVGALAIGGCGSSDSGNSGGAYGSGNSANTESTKSTASETGGEGSAAATFVSVASVPKLGGVIVDSKGFTLYDFHKDKGTKSSCYGECAQVWPPLTTTGKPEPSNGASASKLGTTKRSDGMIQVTYAGHPLYTYVVDTKPGDTKGNDFSSFGAQWYALKANGEEAGD